MKTPMQEMIQNIIDIESKTYNQEQLYMLNALKVSALILLEKEKKKLNNMKLYTEEEVKKAILLSYLTGVERPTDYLLIESILNLKEVASIELPTYEEIIQECNELPIDKHFDRGIYITGKIDGFELGAKWIKEQILNQNK